MKVEYIPGDLVRISFISNDKIFEIIEGGTVNPYIAKDLDGKEAILEEKDIIPIPLTPEILEKNGWKKQKRGNGYVGFSFKRNKFPTIHFQGIELLYVNVPSISSIFLRYVHDLQHLLFGLGLDSNIKL